MKPTARVHEAANLRRLAAEVCLTAIQELKGKDPVTALDAFLWLTGPDFGFWAEVAGIPFADPLQVLTSGGLSRKRVTHGKNIAAA